MLRRWLPKRHIITCAVGGSRRLQSDVPGDPESIRELIRHAEQTQLEKEAVVDSRKVVFSCGASADHRPRIAAAEAFDIAAAALPRPPNFCYVNISVDFSAMLDAPEVVWFNLCKANQLSPSAVEPNQLHLLGGAVCQQRLGGGYIQVMLGCIPDLESDVFTFDAIPEAEDLHQSSRPPPVLCVASLDTKLALQYNQLLSTHIQTLASRLAPTCPLIGGLYPSLSMEDADSSVDDAESKDLNDSMFFINDRIFKGSAVATVLRSNLLQAKSLSVVPSISIGTGRIDKISVSEDLVYTIESINGSPATTVIRDLYTSDDMKDKVSKVFLGVAHQEMVIPVAFSGYPEEGVLRCSLPPGVSLKTGDTLNFVVDDAELDGETAAAQLIEGEKVLNPIGVRKDISVAREARKSIVASNTAALHFSHWGLNALVQPDIPVLNLGNSNTMFAPSILQRCVGRSCATAGIFGSAPVATVGSVTGLFPRSSTYCFLQGKE